MADVTTLLKTENKQATTEVLQLLDAMTPAQKTEILVYTNGFLQGFRAAKVTQGDNAQSKAVAVQTV